MNVYLGSTELDNVALQSTGLEGIYNGSSEVWTSIPLPNYLCFTANTAGSTVQLTQTGSPTSVTLETSTNGRNRSTYTIGTTITLSNIGNKVYFRNTSEIDTGFNIDSGNCYKFEMTGSIAGSGDINFLLNKNSTTTLSSYCYCYIFQNCTGLTTAPALPATTLAERCYNGMFNGCTGLTTPPTISATTLAPSYCCSAMFYGCTGLTTPPTLSATTLASFCYNNMFYGCTALTTTPRLPATTLAERCYNGMFWGCTSLTTLPVLPATTLPGSCYQNMFRNCSKIKLSTTQTGAYQTAYRVPASGTGTAGTNALYYMFNSTGGTYTATPAINTTYYTSNTVVS